MTSPQELSFGWNMVANDHSGDTSNIIGIARSFGLSVQAPAENRGERGLVQDLIISGAASTAVYQLARLVREALLLQLVRISIRRPDGTTVEFDGSRKSGTELADILKVLGAPSEGERCEPSNAPLDEIPSSTEVTNKNGGSS